MVSLNEVMKKFYPMSSGNVHYNCAEASLRSINEYYDLEFAEETYTSMKAFGGGLNVGSTCGLLIGSYAALAHMDDKNKFKDDLNIKVLLREWHQIFIDNFKSEKCNDLRNYNDSCAANAAQSSQEFEKFINQYLRKEEDL